MFFLNPSFWSAVWRFAPIVTGTYVVKDYLDQGLVQQQQPGQPEPSPLKKYAILLLAIAIVLAVFKYILGKRITVK